MNSLGFREIKAWADLRGVDLLDWQLDAIIALDLQRRAVAAQKAADTKEQGKEPDQVSAQPLTPKSMAYLFPGARKRFSRDGKLLN